MRPTGSKGHMANKAHRGYGVQGVWGTGGMEHMGNRPQWVQGYGVQGVWAGYGPHG